MTFAKATRPRRDRSDEFASFTPRPRAIAVPRGILGQLLLRDTGEEIRPQHLAKAVQRERDYMGRVAALGCVVCRLLGLGPTPAQVHHVRAGVGKAQRAGNFCTVPLCEPHHTGPRGVHGDKGCLRQLNLSELDLLDLTIGELAA